MPQCQKCMTQALNNHRTCKVHKVEVWDTAFQDIVHAWESVKWIGW